MESCLCVKEGTTHNVECVICGVHEDVEMTYTERAQNCSQHRMFSCGATEHICTPCRKNGWYSTVGEAGPIGEHKNEKTSAKKDRKERLKCTCEEEKCLLHAKGCYCKEEGKTHKLKCVFCEDKVDVEMTDYYRKRKCPIHKIIMPSAHPDVICGSCKETGMDAKKICFCIPEGLSHNCECVICGEDRLVKMHEVERKRGCPTHRISSFGVHGEFVCLTCKQAGWYSTVGQGGAGQHLNRITGKSKEMNERIQVEKPCICNIKGFNGEVTCSKCGFSEFIMMSKLQREERCLVHRKHIVEYVCPECIEGVTRENLSSPKYITEGKKCSCDIENRECGVQCMKCKEFFLKMTTSEELKERCEVHGKGDEFESKTLCDKCGK